MIRRALPTLILSAALAHAGLWPFSKKDSEQQPHAKNNGQVFPGQYTRGSVAAIPQYTNGKLDLSDRQSLRFHYGKPVWTLPYARITAIEVADKRQNEFVAIPGLTKKKRVFTIAFSDDKGKAQSVELELPVQAAIEALPLLEERSGRTATVEGYQDPNGWWGDRVWKTSSNARKWEEAAGAQPTTKAVAQVQQ